MCAAALQQIELVRVRIGRAHAVDRRAWILDSGRRLEDLPAIAVPSDDIFSLEQREVAAEELTLRRNDAERRYEIVERKRTARRKSELVVSGVDVRAGDHVQL